MDFVDDYRLCGARAVCADSNVGSDDDEILSLCDLPVYNNAEMPAEWASTLRDSNAESSDHDVFDFEFGRSISMEYHSCPADDLIHDGRLLPFNESKAQFPHSKSNSVGRNRLLLNEKLQARRTDSLDSVSSYWTSSSSSSNNSQASHRKLNYSASDKIFRLVNSDAASSIGTSTASAKRPPSGTKMSMKWQQFFTLGLMKTPSMKLQDMRLRQQKPSNNGVDNSIPKRSVSFSSHKGSPHSQKEPGAVNFHRESMSVKRKMSVDKTPRAKGWMKLATLTSLNNCKGSANSVINCTIAKKRVT